MEPEYFVGHTPGQSTARYLLAIKKRAEAGQSTSVDVLWLLKYLDAVHEMHTNLRKMDKGNV